jgi:Domain of unknown function (DUF4291)
MNRSNSALPFRTEPWTSQQARWPRVGRHVLAHYDDQHVTLYQAFKPSIGVDAARHGVFGAEFSRSRMSWVKPGFLWMMFRSGWATKIDQETVLAITVKRAGFDTMLAEAVHSTMASEVYGDEEGWRAALASSSVRLQWDPDHTPQGAKLERRAIQLGLRGTTLQRYANEWITAIDDITDFVRSQHEHVVRHTLEALVVPREDVYPVNDADVASRLGLTVTA